MAVARLRGEVREKAGLSGAGLLKETVIELGLLNFSRRFLLRRRAGRLFLPEIAVTLPQSEKSFTAFSLYGRLYGHLYLPRMFTRVTGNDKKRRRMAQTSGI
jgi:hypothetical protein